MLARFINIFPMCMYLMYFIGVLIFFSDTLRVILMRRKMRHRLRPKEDDSELLTYCGNILSTVFGKDINGIWLVVFEIIAGFFGFIFPYKICGFVISIFSSIVLMVAPVAIMLNLIYTSRSEGNTEGLAFLSELSRNYRANNCNITTAMEKTIESDGEFPICKKAMYTLLVRLRDASGFSVIHECCKSFSFSIGSSWGRMLGGCIEMAVTKGVDVSSGFDDLINQLKYSKELSEERKRLNSESMRMVLVLIPIMYVGSIFVSVRFLGLSLRGFIINQFFTSEGFLFFLLSVVMFIINNLLLSFTDVIRYDV